MDKILTACQLLYIVLLLNVHGLQGEEGEENFPNFVNSKENQAENYSNLQPARKSVHREGHELVEPESPSNHTIPYSEHEEPRDVPTRPKYVAPGLWSKPKKDVPLNFVPTKLHAQVRGTHTVKRLPKSDAIKSAETDDEKENAPRLREVVTNSKVNTIYTEEGYEDSAYDHAGQIRDADFEEDFAKKRRDKLKAERGFRVGSKFTENNKDANSGEEDDYNDYSDHLGADAKLVALDGINRLEKDLRKEDDEAEKYADNYEALNIRNSYERNNYDESRSKSAESANEPDYRGTRKLQVFGMKIKLTTERPTNLKQSESVYGENYEPMDRGASPQSKEIDSTTRGYQSNDPGTLLYVTPVEEEYVSDEQSDIAPPTTVNYGQLAWDYFKAKQEKELNAQPYGQGLKLEEKNSVASTTLYAPYRPLHEVLTTSNPPSLPQLSHPQLEGPTLSHSENLRPLTTMDPLTPYVTLQPFSANAESWTPMEVHQVDSIPGRLYPLSANNLHNIPPSTPIESSENENAVVTTSTESKNNPFPTLLLHNSYAGVQSKPRYKVLVRHKPNKSSKTADSRKKFEQASRQNSSDDFSRNKRVNGFPPRDGESSLDLGFTVMRPPPFAQMRDAYSSSPIVIGQPSVSPEKGFPQESNWKSPSVNFPLEKPAQLPGLNLLARKRNALPATMLVPPSLGVSDEYAKYQLNGRGTTGYGRNIARLMQYAPIIFDLDRKARGLRRRRSLEGEVKADKSSEGGRTMERSRQAGKKHEASGSATKQGKLVKPRNSVSLSKHEVAIDGEGDFGRLGKKDRPKEKDAIGTAISVENEGRSAERNAAREQVSLESKPNFRERRRSRAKSTSHDELLNEAPRIAGSVVEQEIQTRFNEMVENDADNEDDERRKVEVEVPDFHYVEELTEQDVRNISPPNVAKAAVNRKKYPFYNDDSVPKSSPLRYITNPDEVPKKTAGGMEFYESRDAYKECDEVEPSLDEDLPIEEEPAPNREPKENLPRLRGLGDKLDCLKAKYFDDDPFDNPFFSERISTVPSPPSEIDPAKFSSRILLLPGEDHAQISQRLTKKPERKKSRKRTVSSSGRTPDVYRTIRVDRKNLPRIGKIYLHTIRQSKPSKTTARSLRGQRQSVRFQTMDPTTNTPYHRQVYEDVMGNIRSLANSYDHDATTVVPVNHAPSVSSNEHLDTLNVSTFPREKISLVPLINSTGNRMHSNGSITGLVPPPLTTEAPRYHYRRSRHLSKPRPKPNRLRYIGNASKIRIYKRSVTPRTSDLVADESRESREIKELTTIFEPDHELNESSHLDDLKGGEVAGRIYTIRDRIRHSKPKQVERNFGKFVKDFNSSDVSVRRKEPRYNVIRRMNVHRNVTTSPLRSNETASSTVPSMTERSEAINETRLAKIEPVPDILRLGSELRSNKSPETPTQTTTRNASTYAVHESLEEGIETAPVSTNPEINSGKHDAPSSNESECRESTGCDSEESAISDRPKLIEEKTKEDDDRSRSIDYYDESNEKSPARLESSSLKESESESESESEENGSREHGGFFKSTPHHRENERNSKKSRLNPGSSFLRSMHSGSSEDASVSEEDEPTERYVFPWDRVMDDDEEESGRSSHYLTSIDYEYPWERRDRLARERDRRRKQSKRDGLKLFFKDDNDHGTRSKWRSYVYPWDRYEVPSIDHINSGTRLRRKRIFDNEQTSSEKKPVTKFSSRYNLSKVRLNENTGASADNDMKTGEPGNVTTTTYSVLSGIDMFNSTTEIPSTVPPVGKHKNFFGGIVPENITPAPRRKNGKGRMLLNEKRKLNHLFKPTNVSLIYESSDVVTERRPHAIVTFGITNAPERGGEETSTALADISAITDPTESRHRRRKLRKNSVVSPTTVSNVESSSESIKANRGRGRSRFSTTTPTSGFIYATTASPRIIRRRPTPSSTHGRKTSNVEPTTESAIIEAPLQKTTKHRSRIVKEHKVTRTSHPRDKLIAENSTIPHRLKMIPESKVKAVDGEGKNYSPTLTDLWDYSDVIGQINEANNGGSFNSKEIDPFGSIIQDDEESLKSDLSSVEILPSQQKVVQLTQHGTRNIVSSASWISENYDY